MSLPASGSLSIKTAAGAGNSIAQEVDGNTSGNKSLSTLSVTAGKSAPHSMLEFRGFSMCTAAPQAPTSASLSSPMAGAISFSWSHSGLGQVIEHFRIEYTRAGNPGVWVFVTNVSKTTFSYGTSGLVSDQYIFRVRAENNCGNSTYATSGSANVS